MGHSDDVGCVLCHCRPDTTVWGGCIKGKEAALARAWRVKVERWSGGPVVQLPVELNRFDSEYVLGMWPQHVDYELVDLSDDGLDKRIVKVQGFGDVMDLVELPDVIVTDLKYGGDFWMSEKKIGKYLLQPADRKRFVEAA